MAFLSVVLAAAAAWAFGSVWYMVLAKPWMAAAGLSPDMIRDENGKMRSGPAPFILSFVCAVLVAGMMRHIFSLSGITSPGEGLVAGLGIGLFLVSPWIATNYLFSMRPRVLTLIDGGYATGGCIMIGLVLTLF